MQTLLPVFVFSCWMNIEWEKEREREREREREKRPTYLHHSLHGHLSIERLSHFNYIELYEDCRSLRIIHTPLFVRKFHLWTIILSLVLFCTRRKRDTPLLTDTDTNLNRPWYFAEDVEFSKFIAESIEQTESNASNSTVSARIEVIRTSNYLAKFYLIPRWFVNFSMHRF